MRVFGIDPGSERTGYGCVETDGRRHRLVICGAISHRRRAPTSRRAWRPSTATLVVHLRELPAGGRGHREPVPRRQRPQRARSSATPAASPCWRRSRPACRWSSTRRPRSSGRWSATAAPRRAQVQQMIKLLLGLEPRADRRTTPPTRWPWRSAIVHRLPGTWRSSPAPAERRHRPAGGPTVRPATRRRSGSPPPAAGPPSVIAWLTRPPGREDAQPA